MGCVFTLAAIIFLPIIVAIIAIFLGTIAVSILIALISTILFVVLSKNGIFTKYKNSPKEWQRILAAIAKALLIIIIMIFSYFATLALIAMVALFNI